MLKVLQLNRVPGDSSAPAGEKVFAVVPVTWMRALSALQLMAHVSRESCPLPQVLLPSQARSAWCQLMLETGRRALPCEHAHACCRQPVCVVARQVALPNLGKQSG